MHNQEFILAKLRESKGELIAKYPISELALFGSYSRGDNHNESDVDILVELNGKIGMRFFQIARDLEQLLQKKVDLVSRRAIKQDYFEQIEKDLIYV
jgi:predicted nucleotidyltransferase